MGLIDKLFGDGVKGILNGAKGIVSQFKLAPDEKEKFELETKELLLRQFEIMEAGVNREVSAKERIMVAELQQSDNYTKRARPTIVYTGLLLGLLEFVIRTVGWFSGMEMPDVSTFVPTQFWVAWGSVTGLYAIGRSAEKRGMKNKIVSALTGNAAA